MILPDWTYIVLPALVAFVVSFGIGRIQRKFTELDNLETANRDDIRFAHRLIKENHDEFRSSSTVTEKILGNLARSVQGVQGNLHKVALLFDDIATWIDWAHPVIVKAKREKPRVRLAMHRDTPTKSLVAKNRLRG